MKWRPLTRPRFHQKSIYLPKKCRKITVSVWKKIWAQIISWNNHETPRQKNGIQECFKNLHQVSQPSWSSCRAGWCSTLTLLRPFARVSQEGKWSSRLLMTAHHDLHNPDRVSILIPPNLPRKHLSRNSQNLKHLAGGKIHRVILGIRLIPTRWAPNYS